MRYSLFAYNIIFLIFGNILFSSIHHSHDYNHDHDTSKHECVDCFVLDSNQNFILDTDGQIFLKVHQTLLVLQAIISTPFIYIIKNNSRAPPAQ